MSNRRVGENRNIYRVSQIGNVDAADHVSVRIDAAAHSERVKRKEIRVAVRAVVPETVIVERARHPAGT